MFLISGVVDSASRTCFHLASRDGEFKGWSHITDRRRHFRGTRLATVRVKPPRSRVIVLRFDPADLGTIPSDRTSRVLKQRVSYLAHLSLRGRRFLDFEHCELLSQVREAFLLEIPRKSDSSGENGGYQSPAEKKEVLRSVVGDRTVERAPLIL